MQDPPFRGFAFDARHLQTGIGAYTRNLLRNLHALGYAPAHLLTRSEHRDELLPYCERVTVVDAPIYSAREQVEVPWAARHDALLHVPHYNAPLLYPGRLLATIHDLTHLLDPHYRRTWKARLYAAPMLHTVAHRAAHLFTVSEYSRRQIVERLGVAEDRITVVYNGVGEQFCPGDRERARQDIALRFGVSRPFLLYVGDLKPHKNVETLLEAYALLVRNKMADFELVIASPGDAEELRLRAEQMHVRPRFVEDASDNELADLYRAAEVLVLPSFEEGFGLPVIEAMACGTPVICANAAALPEVAGDAALLFDPQSPHDLHRALEQVLSSAELRQSLRDRGLKRAAQLTWRDTAERHIAVYRRFLG